MRLASTSILLAFAITACGNHGSSSGDDGNTAGDDGRGGDDGNNHGATNVTVTVNNHPTNAMMFAYIAAYQDGGGAWQLAPAPAGDTYTLPINSPAWGFVWTCVGTAAPAVGGGQVRQVAEYHFAVAERTSLTIDVPPRCTDRLPMPVGLHGTIANNNGGGVYIVRWGDRVTVAAGNGTYAMEVPPGTHDLLVVHAQITGGAGDLVADSTLVQRGLAVTAATTANIDFANAALVQSFPVTLSGTGRVVASTTVYTAGGTSGPLVNDSAPTYETESFAAAQMTAGDVYDQSMLVASNGQTAITTNATATPAAQTWAAPTPLGGATSMSSPTPYPRITTTWNAYANTVGYGWAATQQPTLLQCGGTIPCQVAWAAALSPGVIGAMPTYTMPDLSALAGWDPRLQFQTGTMVTGTVQAMTSSAGASDFPQATPPAAGTQRVFVRSDYTVTP